MKILIVSLKMAQFDVFLKLKIINSFQCEPIRTLMTHFSVNQTVKIRPFFVKLNSIIYFKFDNKIYNQLNAFLNSYYHTVKKKK